MTRSFLAIFVLVMGGAVAATALVVAALALRGLLAVAAFCLICAGIARGLDRVLDDERPEPAEAYGADEGAWRG